MNSNCEDQLAILLSTEKKLEKQKHGSDPIELFMSCKLDHFITVTILSHSSETVQLTKIERWAQSYKKFSGLT